MEPSRLFSHFIAIFLATFSVIFTSITVATHVGIPTLSTISQQIVVVTMLHIFVLFVAFNVRTLSDLDIRTNPLITLVEGILHQKLEILSAMVELTGQLLAAIVASLIFWAGNKFPAPIAHPSIAYAICLEIIAMTVISWVYFHNYYHKKSHNFPYTMAAIIGVTSGLVFPTVGSTTHNPFRWLANCVPSGTCSGEEAAIFLGGPAAGVLLGYVAHYLTQWNTLVKIEKNKRYGI